LVNAVVILTATKEVVARLGCIAPVGVGHESQAVATVVEGEAAGGNDPTSILRLAVDRTSRTDLIVQAPVIEAVEI
jgi:hypothetical protein